MFQFLVGLIVVAIAGLGYALFWWTLNATNTLANPSTQELVTAVTGPILYSWQSPPLFAAVFAIVLAFSVAFTFISIESRDINKSRRSRNLRRKPLAPWVMMSETRGVFHGEVTVTVLVPAHNEEAKLGETLDALMRQDRLPDRVVVVADNCTDRTIEIARQRGFEVFESSNNKDKKAGALNQALPVFLAQAGPNDTFMIMDADTHLKQGFIRSAVQHFTRDRGLSAIGGLFFGEPGHGIIGQLQRNEFVRYSREINRRRGRVFVLTGTASIFRAPALKAVADSRGSLIPGLKGQIYDTAALTEDNELTIALKSLGALMISPSDCLVETELMPNSRSLWRQRLRWQRGALENISAYGISGTTSRYWSQQLGIAYSVIALWSFFTLITIQVLATDVWIWYPFWLLTGLVFVIERVYTVWSGGWKARGLAALLIPELLYDSYLDLIFLKGVIDILFKRDAQWGQPVSRKVNS